MDQITQQNAANSEESASAAEELSGQAQEMQSMVSSFKLSNTSSNRPAVRPTVTHSSPAKKKPEKVLVGAGKKSSAGSDPAKVIPFDDDSDVNTLQEF
jgi:methyl-accepting chemotaxis protein